MPLTAASFPPSPPPLLPIKQQLLLAPRPPLWRRQSTRPSPATAPARVPPHRRCHKPPPRLLDVAASPPLCQVCRDDVHARFRDKQTCCEGLLQQESALCMAETVLCCISTHQQPEICACCIRLQQCMRCCPLLSLPPHQNPHPQLPRRSHRDVELPLHSLRPWLPPIWAR